MPFLLRFPLLLVFALSAQALRAQPALVLTKRASHRLEKIFFVGDRITFRLQGGSGLETGIITQIVPAGFHANGRLVPADSLELVSETNRGLKLGLGVLSVAAGSVMLFSGVFQGFWVYALGSAFLGTGLIQSGLYGTRLLLHNRYNVKRKWRIDVREMEKESD